MSDNQVLKVTIASLVLLLILAIVGVSESFNFLRWSVLSVSLILTSISFSSKRYRWGIVFLIFAILFNPWVRPSFSKMEWVFADVALSASLIFWLFDYFQNYHKGLLFERLVQNKFPANKYVLVNSTKDLHKKLRRFVESDTNPDFVFREKATGKTFAVECKYRSSYISGNLGDEGIWWKKDQGERYLHYAKENNIPTYIAIGVEGNPKSPKTIAFIPIEIIQKQYFKFIPRKIIDQYHLLPTN